MTDGEKAIKLLKELDLYVQTTHLDMGGKHKYTITFKGHEVYTRIREFLNELYNKEFADGRFQ